MKSALRVGTAAIALAMGIAAPALAQDEGASSDSAPISIAPPPPAAAQDAVGPAQLRDFSINGTVTRRAETPATASPQPTRPTATANPPRASATLPTETRSVASRSERPAGSAAQPSTAPAPSASAAAGTGFNFTPSAPTTGQSASFTPDTLAQPTATPIVDTYSGTDANFLSHWPWLLAFLFAGGAALWYFRRQRGGGYALAGAGGDASTFDFSAPQPAPAPPAPPRAAPVAPPAARAPVPTPAPVPAPPPAAPVGIVSTRLRPWLDIDFQPLSAVIDGEKGAIEFDVIIHNSGSGPARDVFVEAALFNAGPDQDELIGQFFARPAAPGDRIEVIPPLQRMEFRTAVQLKREQMRIFEVEGRSLFVPLIGFNAHYRWSNGEGQTSASYIVGRNTDGEKMAPFLVGEGPKSFRGLGAREHTLRVRK
jgi:hypothetical protein